MSEPPKILFDVRRPIKSANQAAVKIVVARHILEKRPVKNSGNKFWRPVIFCAVTAAVIFILNIFSAGSYVKKTLSLIYGEVPKIEKAIPEFNISDIVKSLEVADGGIKEAESRAENSGLVLTSVFLGKFMPSLGELPGALRNVSFLSDKILLLGRDIEYLKNNGIELAAGQKGDDLINVLERMQISLREISSLNSNLKAQSPSLKNLSPKLASLYDIFNRNYIYINLNISRAEKALDGLLSILRPSEDRHLLLLFQNPSEIRPAGGFIGSYGVMTLNRGNLKNLQVDDIYNADRQTHLKLIPPKELQIITKDWGARDANWFFNFQTSAQKVLAFIEDSDLYNRKEINFEGVVSINTNVLATILDITGPISVPGYDLELDSENFLKEIQYEVEAGRDKKPGQNPKKVLSVFAPILMDKLVNLGGPQKELLLQKFKNHFEEKDIMVYFRDWRLENFADELGISGNVLELPDGFSGDYLAVVNANIAGGKTDAFINQKISLKSVISEDGTVMDSLVISRKHNGGNESDWWYRMANKDYIKIFAPEDAKLISLSGNGNFRSADSAYSKDYMKDIDLESIEKNSKLSDKFRALIGKESGKASFGAWLDTQPGKTGILTAGYKFMADVGDGKAFNFIFEKQSGVGGSLEYSVSAPDGYIWKESGGRVFEYTTSRIKARKEVNLTMVRG